MAWSSSPSGRRAALPRDWYGSIRPRILRRDQYRCQWGSLPADVPYLGSCTSRASDVDHIGPAHLHRDDNLRSLCRTHHALRSGGQGGQASGGARQARIKARYRTAEPHPGMR